jgi:hypothetical protein
VLNDDTIKIWDLATGRISTIAGHSDSVVDDLQLRESNADLSNTDLGTFDLQTVAISTGLGSPSAGRSSPIAAGYSLRSKGTWIAHQGKNLLRLPPEYRPSCVAISGTAVSIGCYTGRVMIFIFTDSNLIP